MMAMLISLMTQDIGHSPTFCSYCTSLNNHENPCRLLLLALYNNNKIREPNQIKNTKSSLYSLKYPLWVPRVCGAYLRFKAPWANWAHNLISQQWRTIGNLCYI